MSKRNIYDTLTSIETSLHNIDRRYPGFSDSAYQIDISSHVPTILVDDSEHIYRLLESPETIRDWVNTSYEYFWGVHEPQSFMVFGIENMRVLVNGRKQVNYTYLLEVIRDYVARRLPNSTDLTNYAVGNIDFGKTYEPTDEKPEITFWAGSLYYIHYEEDSGVFQIEDFSGEFIWSTGEFQELLEQVLRMISECYNG